MRVLVLTGFACVPHGMDIVRALTGPVSHEEPWRFQGLFSLSRRTSYHKTSWSLKPMRFGFRFFQSLWNLTGTSVTLQSQRACGVELGCFLWCTPECTVEQTVESPVICDAQWPSCDVTVMSVMWPGNKPLRSLIEPKLNHSQLNSQKQLNSETMFCIMEIHLHLKKWKHIYRPNTQLTFDLYGHFECFQAPHSKKKPHLLSTVLLSGFQSSPGAFKFTE